MKRISTALSLVFSLVLFGAGCAQKAMISQTPKASTVEGSAAPGPSMASETTNKESFCRFQAQASATKEKNALWASPEYFNGMNHAPTIQHVCRGEKELFFLEMHWDDDATPHTGTLIAFSSSSTMPISSPNTDPDFKLLGSDIDHPDRIRISIDGKIIIFDEGRNQFVN